jgi:hypothetical protein
MATEINADNRGEVLPIAEKTIQINLQGAIPPIKGGGIYELVANQPGAINTVIIRVELSVIDKGNPVYIVLPATTNYSDGVSPIIYVIDNNFTATSSQIIVGTRAVLKEENNDYINGGDRVTMNVDGGNICVQCITRGVYIASGTIDNGGLVAGVDVPLEAK